MHNQDTPLTHNKIPAPIWKTFGHDNAIKNLLSALNQNRFAHAYLITGAQNIGKTTLAVDMAA